MHAIRASIVRVSEPPFRERRIPPDEVHRIVKRATELSAGNLAAENPARALTREELEQHLHELGMSETVVKRAFSPPPEPVQPAADGVLRVVREVELEGMLSSDHFEELAELISSRMGMPGNVSVVGNRLTWSPSGALIEPAVTVHAKNGRTKIRYVETLANRTQMRIGFGTLGGFAGMIAGSGALVAGVAIAKAAGVTGPSGNPTAIALVAASVAVGLAAAIGSFVGLKRVVARRGVTRSQFADDLVAVLESRVRAQLASTPARVRVIGATADEADTRVEAEAEVEAAEIENEALAARRR
ncbi:MAG: hypothetical protein U0263_19845 [Polyangiaceae bacterium]